MKITVLIPTHDHGKVAFSAIDSVREQTHDDWELFIIADGAPQEALTHLENYTRGDERIRLFSFPKGERHGEAWRHEALQQARGEAVCYLSDDDIWLPEHLLTMEHMLETADFAQARHVELLPDFTLCAYDGRIDNAATRARMVDERYNAFGLSNGGHRMDAYRRLPIGWSPAPTGLWTDLHMWRKFIALEGVGFATSMTATSLNFARPRREGQDVQTMEREIRFWQETFRDPLVCDVVQSLLEPTCTILGIDDILLRAAAQRAEAVAVEARKQEEREAEHRRVLGARQAEVEAARAELDQQSAYAAQQREDAAQRHAAEIARQHAEAEHQHAVDAARIEALAAARDAARMDANTFAARGDALQRELNAIDNARYAAEQELERMRNTATWRFTAPLRAVWARVRAQLKRTRGANG